MYAREKKNKKTKTYLNCVTRSGSDSIERTHTVTSQHKPTEIMNIFSLKPIQLSRILLIKFFAVIYFGWYSYRCCCMHVAFFSSKKNPTKKKYIKKENETMNNNN